MRILLLDDDRLFTKYMHDIMADRDVHFDSASNLEQAETMIKNNHYDLLFLDILVENGELNGIQFMEQHNLHELIPYIVVISGFDNYSLEAYKIHPFDYLVKPTKKQDIINIVDAIQLRIVQNEVMYPDEQLITIKDKKNVHRIPLDEVLFIEKIDRDIVFHFKDYEILVSGTLSGTKKLLPRYFVQSHRAFVINLKRIISIIDAGNRTYTIKFQNTEKEAILSRGFADDLFRIIRQSNDPE